MTVATRRSSSSRRGPPSSLNASRSSSRRGAETVHRQQATGFELPVVEARARRHRARRRRRRAGRHAEEGTTRSSPRRPGPRRPTPRQGLFRGTQSLRQTFRRDRAHGCRRRRRMDSVRGSIADAPRFAYRGAMLDVARHFFPVEERRLHRCHRPAEAQRAAPAPHRRPGLAHRDRVVAPSSRSAAPTSVGGDGGYYTKDDYRRIVEYAAERFITIVPEIDLPGHTNAALSAYPEPPVRRRAPAALRGASRSSSRAALRLAAGEDDRFLADVTRAPSSDAPAVAAPRRRRVARDVETTTSTSWSAPPAAAATGKTVIGWHEMGASTGFRTAPWASTGARWSPRARDPSSPGSASSRAAP